MAAFLTQNFYLLFALVQLTGISSAVLARSGESPLGQAVRQSLFLATLPVVAIVTLGCLVMGWSAWVVSGSTFSLMVVTAIWDPGLRTAS
jgi:hypothetical protein